MYRWLLEGNGITYYHGSFFPKLTQKRQSFASTFQSNRDSGGKKQKQKFYLTTTATLARCNQCRVGCLTPQPTVKEKPLGVFFYWVWVWKNTPWSLRSQSLRMASLYEVKVYLVSHTCKIQEIGGRFWDLILLINPKAQMCNMLLIWTY